MSKKCPEPEPEADNERWLVSFADFMTLLFALFVVLFANSQSEDGPSAAQISRSIENMAWNGRVSSEKLWPVTNSSPMALG